MAELILNTLTPEKFLSDIENLVKTKSLDYMDAIVYYCEKTGMEIETAASIVKNTQKLKAKVQLEAEELNFLQKTARLDI